MKIALINLPLDNNYGGNLQRYALYTVLTRLGHDVTYLPMLTKMYTPKGIHKILSKAKRFAFEHVLHKEILIDGIPVSQYEKDKAKELKIQIPAFLNFTKEHVNTYPRNFNDFGELKSIVSEFDTFVVGSDQAWRNYSPNTLPHYYLDFVPVGKRKIAYAISFGNSATNYSRDLVKRCGKLVSTFNAVSFRESSGIEITHKFNWKINNPEIVLDPTLLLRKEDYLALMPEGDSNNSRNLNRKLFYYILDDNGFKANLVSKISDQLGLSPYGLNTLFPNIGKNTSIILPSPGQWLKDLYESDFVVTDSFHGTLFSIIFNKPFITIMNNKRGAERYNPLINNLGLEDRIVNDNSLRHFDFNEFYQISWEEVNKKLESYREKSIHFLINCLRKSLIIL